MSEEESAMISAAKRSNKFGIVQKVLCCKCFPCCQEQDQSLLSSTDRKRTLKSISSPTTFFDNRLLAKDPFQILIGLYLSDEISPSYCRFIADLQKCRINADYNPKNSQRNDLEYYIPQLCSYIAFHQEFKDESIIGFIKQAGQLNFYFAHLLFFYIRSISSIVTKNQTTQLQIIERMQEELLKFFEDHYKTKQLIQKELANEIMGKLGLDYPTGQYLAIDNDAITRTKEMIKKYGTIEQDEVKIDKEFRIVAANIQLPNYQRRIYSEGQKGASSQGDIADKNNGQEYQGSSQLQKQDSPIASGFSSTISFFDDLIAVSELLKFADPKIIALRTYIKDINQHLPASVYVPFFSQQIRTHVVLNIIPSDCRVFSTKERSPFYICLELFSPDIEEQFAREEKNSKTKFVESRKLPDWKREYILSKPQTVFDHLHSSPTDSGFQYVYQSERDRSTSMLEKTQQQTIKEQNLQFKQMTYDDNNAFCEMEDFQETQNNSCSLSNGTLGSPSPPDQQREQDNSEKSLKINEQMVSSGAGGGIACAYELSLEDMKSSLQSTLSQQEDSNQQSAEENLVSKAEMQSTLTGHAKQKGQIENDTIKLPEGQVFPRKSFAKRLFGEDQADQERRIKRKSPYGHFHSWKLVHFIVKTGDNLKQEQFAQQLIYQFQQIFNDSGLNLKLRPYEIVSLSPNAGILEVVKNSVTIDSLKKTLREDLKTSATLFQFFQLFYGENLRQAQHNFCSSLAAYSLVCYFLQIKDRHNGNILLHKEGYIVHIDFGFLLSNAPGKGLAFENSVPFKLLSEYVDILGGFDSDLFKTYRQLFYKGFLAAKKNQDKILILAKMLFSSHGTSLPCFEKGEEAILALEERFNPKNFTLDSELFVHTNQLINMSLDNWKSRWYDKWQYLCQGIFY